jgi:DNA-directed RNA polymerase subunit H (RpoH/RPB5)
MKNSFFKKAAIGIIMAAACMQVLAEDYYTVAVLPFSERGAGVRAQGEQVSELVFADLVNNPKIWMVERAELEKILKELELNTSGMVNPSQATKLGEMTGAKLLVTGSVMKLKDKTVLIGKVIGTETSRVLGGSVKGTEGIEVLSEKLAKKISGIISTEAGKLMPKIKTRENIIAELKKKIGDAKKPKVYIKITERHVGQATIDPAAETEMQLICKQVGFDVTDDEGAADVLLKGEGFSEFATRRGNLISVRARVEVKATDKKNNVLAVGRQTDISVGLAEQAVGKQALQNASAQIAERLLPQIVKQ